MNKTIALALSAVVVVALGAATLNYKTKSGKLENQNLAQQKEIVFLAEDNEVKTERILELESQVADLLSEVESYKKRIAELEDDLAAQQKKIRNYDAKIKSRNRSIAKLKDEITALARSRDDNSAKIKKLEAEKRKLLDQISKEDAALALAERQQLMTEAEIEKARIEKMRADRIADIVQNTNVAFEKVELRERKDSGKMRKIKKDKWRYTHLNFYLQHKEGPRAIMDENFTVIIRDLDTGKVLPYNEGNPARPGNKVETGFPVTYNGNMMVVDYYNSEVKVGKNYQVEVLYVLNGKHYPMPGGAMKIIDDRKVVKI